MSLPHYYKVTCSGQLMHLRYTPQTLTHIRNSGSFYINVCLSYNEWRKRAQTDRWIKFKVKLYCH